MREQILVYSNKYYMSRKVLFVHDGPLYVSDKQEYYGVHYTNAIVKRYSYFGDSVTFMMRSRKLVADSKQSFSRIDCDNFSFVDVPNFKSILTRINIKKAKHIIKENVRQHDVIIVRLPSAIGVIAYNEAKRLNKPVLVEMVACVFDALWNYDWRGKLLAHYKMASYKRLIAKATHVVYVTDKFLQGRYPSYNKQLGCSNVNVTIDDSALDSRLAKINGNDSFSVLTIGTVAALDVPYKGQAAVIEAIHLLKSQGIQVNYHLVGQGNPDSLEKLIKKLKLSDQVKIIGPLAHNKVFEFYRQIDLYIQPSRQEGLPRAVIEAMSQACPVLGSRAGGIPELIQEDCLFDAGNASAIASLIRAQNVKSLEEHAIYNFETSKKYARHILETNRFNFYDEFKKDFNL